MTQAHVDELEAMVPEDGQADKEYIGKSGLFVRKAKGPNKWYQNVTRSKPTQGGNGASTISQPERTSIKLGWTKRISLADAVKIGDDFKVWAVGRTRQECRDVAKMFREYAKTEVEGKQKVSVRVLRDALDRATGSTDNSQGDAKITPSPLPPRSPNVFGESTQTESSTARPAQARPLMLYGKR